MVVFDATILLALLNPDIQPPRHPETHKPVDSFRDRIDYLVRQLEESRDRIIIPAPALSEILVRADEAAPEYLKKINSAAVFQPVPFDERAAVEAAAMTRAALDASGDKRGGQKGTWSKIKYDRQILAIAKVSGASAVYSDDRGIFKFGQKLGLTVIRTADLPLPPIEPQMNLQLSGDGNDGGDESPPDRNQSGS